MSALLEDDTGSGDHTRPDVALSGHQNGVWRVGLAGIVAALVALHLFLSRSMDGFLLADGTGYLANARWLAGKAGSTWQGPAAFYNAGWSLVVAPIYWFTRTPDAVHAAVLAVNAVLASAAFVAYAAVAETVLGLRRRVAIVAGLVAATYPAVLLQASFEWSESLFHLLFPLLVLAADRLLRRGTIGAGLATGLAAAALNATHPKGLGAVVAVGVALVALLARRSVPRQAAIAGLAALVITFLATRVLHGALQDALYDRSAAAIEGDVLGRITDPALVWGAFKRLWGQLWYLTVASLGLFPLGVVAFARARDRRLAGIVLGTSLVVLAASCLQMSDGTRVDHMVYGRYAEGFLPLVLVGSVALLVERHRDALRLAAIGAGMAAAFAVLTVLLNGGDRFTGDVMPLNVVGVLVYRTDENAVDVLAVTALAMLPLLAVALVTRLRAVAGAGLVALFFVGSSVSVEARTIRPWEDYWSSVTEIPEVVHRIGFEGPVAYDLAAYDVDAADLYQLELTDVGPVLFFDSSTSEHRPGTDLVIASSQWVEPGTRLVFAESGIFRQALWVRAGDLQDDLDERGLLVPEQYAAPLSMDARRASLDARVDGDELVVRVRNDGSTWLPVGPIDGVVQGTVRLGVRLDGSDDATATAELPGFVLPGDEVTIRVDLDQLDLTGPARAVVSLRQEGVAWWDESAVELELSP